LLLFLAPIYDCCMGNEGREAVQRRTGRVD
jgi:hypothetical protein